MAKSAKLSLNSVRAGHLFVCFVCCLLINPQFNSHTQSNSFLWVSSSKPLLNQHQKNVIINLNFPFSNEMTWHNAFDGAANNAYSAIKSMTQIQTKIPKQNIEYCTVYGCNDRIECTTVLVFIVFDRQQKWKQGKRSKRRERKKNKMNERT